MIRTYNRHPSATPLILQSTYRPRVGEEICRSQKVSPTSRSKFPLWHEKTDIDQCKFGERWVKEGQDPEKEVLKRIKDSVGVRKDKINDGTIELVSIWDVSKLAQDVGRFKMHGRIDDYIREFIGFRKGTTGEVHTLSAVDMAFKVNEFLKKQNQPLMKVGLSQNQYSAAEKLLPLLLEAKELSLLNCALALARLFGLVCWQKKPMLR